MILVAFSRLKVVKNTDKRVGTMNEIITSMQVTKMYTWEEPYAKHINEVRRYLDYYILFTHILNQL